MKYAAVAVTDAGIVKKVNQDSLTVKVAQSPWGEVCMAVVCDGLGGLSMGEVASGNVIIAFDRWFKEIFLTADTVWTQERIRSEWENLVFSMNSKIKEFGGRQRVELGTTLTAVLFIGQQYYVIHVGDSRLYEICEDCHSITKDQTLIAQEVERGILTEEQALTDSRKNVLLQCIGVTDRLVPCFLSGTTKENASYLVCSDGFRHVITPQEIWQQCRNENNPTPQMMQNHLQELVEWVKRRGERDNISAILVQAVNGIC